MNDQDYIRKAVELADGWFNNWDRPFCDAITHNNAALCIMYENMDQWMLDTLAAQLVRQVDALDDYWVDSDNYRTAKVWMGDCSGPKSRIAKSNDDDRTMNTIKAIVDSKVLE